MAETKKTVTAAENAAKEQARRDADALKRNPYARTSYDELVTKIQEFGKQMESAILTVADVKKEESTGRDIAPATDPSGLMILALTAMKSEYAKSMHDIGGATDKKDAMSTAKKKAEDARKKLREALKSYGEANRAVIDANEYLNDALDSHYGRHGDEVDQKAAAKEEAAQKLLDDAKKLRAAKARKGRKTATANA